MSPKHTLYQSLRSPFARRVRVLLEELGVAYELQVIDVFNPPKAFYEVNPLGRVPALKIGDSQQVIVDSNAIVAFLQARHSTHPLFQVGGQGSVKVGRVSALAIGLMETTIPVFLESLRPKGLILPQVIEDFTADIHRALTFLESEFTGPFYCGEKLGYWDIDLGAALGYIDLRMGSAVCDRYPRLRQYFKTLNCRPSFQKTIPPA